MAELTRQLISELKRDKRFMGTCPRCGEDFPLRRATLFTMDDQPADATKALMIALIKNKIQEAELKKAKYNVTEGAQKRAQAVNLGNILEKICPSFDGLSYARGDCRALSTDRFLSVFGIDQE